MIDFIEGDVVICINDDPAFGRFPLPFLKRGNMYRVTRIFHNNGHVFVELRGDPEKNGYDPNRFEKLPKSKIDIFKLVKKKEPTHEHA